jgi:hypothetical protein
LQQLQGVAGNTDRCEQSMNFIGLLQVNQWLMWLAEAESEEEEEEDGDN